MKKLVRATKQANWYMYKGAVIPDADVVAVNSRATEGT